MERAAITSWKSPPARSASTAPFFFLDPGPLVDRELELIRPDPRWVDAVLLACHHPRTRAEDPEHAAMTRPRLQQFLQAAPDGIEAGNISAGRSPAYHFWMHLRPEYRPPLSIAGAVSLRVGQNLDLQMYMGHVGYNVYPPAQGHHYAERACRLLLPLARAHGLSPLWITANPENLASRRTCECLGAKLVEIVDLPPNHMLYLRGQRRKCRYRLEL